MIKLCSWEGRQNPDTPLCPLLCPFGPEMAELPEEPEILETVETFKNQQIGRKPDGARGYEFLSL